MKICIVCLDFNEKNIRLQPWRYIYEISTIMTLNDIEVKIISNGYPSLPKEEKIDGVVVYHLKQLRAFPYAKNQELVNIIEKESPDIILFPISATSFYYFTTLKTINKPIIGLWMGTIYDLNQIWSLGMDEISRNFKSINIHIINSILPSFLVKPVLKLQNLKKIIVLNFNNKNKLLNYGVSSNNIVVIPPGIGKYDLEPPNNEEINDLRDKLEIDKNSFVVLYLGSPLTIRGVDILIKAFSIANKSISSLKLIILSRHHDNLKNEEDYIKNLCRILEIEKNVKIISGFLDKNEVKKYILLSDTVALPFKLVQSDSPTSILEVMALGKPVISTKLDGIPELLENGRGFLINPNDTKDLVEAIFTLYSDSYLRKDMGEKAREYMMKYPGWNQITQNIVSMVNETIN